MAKKVLVVDDEKLIVKGIRFSLEQDGMEVDCAYDGEEALNMAKANEYDMILLDIMLPKMDGFEVCQAIREFSDMPIVMLTAKGDDMDKILGLDYGADDYITKPFQSMELVARVRSHLRRYEQILNLKNETKNEDEYMIGDLVLNNTTKRVTLNSRDIKLTPKEFDILVFFLKHKDIVIRKERLMAVFSSQQIYELVWKEEAINTETIMVHIRKLREKIETNPKKPIYIKVVWGQGYKMDNIQ